MAQDQKIGEIEVGLEQLERAFELLMVNACGWRNSVQLLREDKVKSVKVRRNIEVLTGARRPPDPVPPPRVGIECYPKPYPKLIIGPRVGNQCAPISLPLGREGVESELPALIDEYISDVHAVLGALFEALEGLERGSVGPGGPPS